MYLFKRDLVNMIREAASTIHKLYKDKYLRSSFANKDKDKDLRSGFANKDVDKMMKDIKELNIDSNRKLIEAANRLYKELI